MHSDTQVPFKSLLQPGQCGRHVPPQGLSGLNDGLQLPLHSTSALQKGEETATLFPLPLPTHNSNPIKFSDVSEAQVQIFISFGSKYLE